MGEGEGGRGRPIGRYLKILSCLLLMCFKTISVFI